MSTLSVPGHNPQNKDKLSIGCWAEHEDGSMIFVKGIDENDTVVFEMYDLSDLDHPVYYPHALSLVDFEKSFSFDPKKKNGKPNLKWTWHDKTPFDWSRVMRVIQRPLPVSANIQDQVSATAQMVESLNIRLKEALTPDVIHSHQGIDPRLVGRTSKTMAQRLKNAISELVG